MHLVFRDLSNNELYSGQFYSWSSYFFFFFSMVSKKKESNVFFFVDVQRTYSNKMLRIDLEKNSFSRTKKINKIMFVLVVSIMNSEPFIKVGYRISESSRSLFNPIPKFSDISKSCK